jgi:DNA-binding NarL/FixJ family response regulator
VSRLIRVMVVEDHHLVRAGLIALLSMVEDFDVVAEAGDGAAAVEQFRVQCPDVTLIDLRLPRLSGAEVIKSLRKESEQARFVVLTAHDGEEDVYRAVQAGAQAYLLKGSTNDELVETIRLVYEGKSHFPVEIAAILARRLSAAGLTTRETSVLERIVQGMTNKQIALLLDISEATVKAHVNGLLNKLGVADRTQAATTAILRGIVTLEFRGTERQSSS